MATSKQSPKASASLQTPLSSSEVLASRTDDGSPVRLVEIVWNDAVDITGGGWVEHEQIVHAPALSLSVGYLICETPESYTLAALVNENHYSHGIVIPKGMVVEIREQS